MNSLLCWGVCEAAMGLGVPSSMGAQVSLSGVHLPPLLSRCHRCSSILRVAIRAQ